MQTTLVLAMLQSRMRLDEGHLSVELATSCLRHIYDIYVCSDVNMSLSRCKWCIIVGNDSIEEDGYGS